MREFTAKRNSRISKLVKQTIHCTAILNLFMTNAIHK